MKFEKTEVFNFEGAIRGMRNPMDSHYLSDSNYCLNIEYLDCKECNRDNCDVDYSYTISPYVIMRKDLDLAQRLIKAGSEHAKFMRQIFVSVDITAPRYWWQEFDTYKIGTTANSCSTMHKIKDYPFTRDMFEIDEDSWDDWWDDQIDVLEYFRKLYVETKDVKYLRTLKQRLPESFLQKRTVSLNYAVIRTILQQRKNHKLLEWNTDFVNWVKKLPYSEKLILINIIELN